MPIDVAAVNAEIAERLKQIISVPKAKLLGLQSSDGPNLEYKNLLLRLPDLAGIGKSPQTGLFESSERESTPSSRKRNESVPNIICNQTSLCGI